MKTKILLLIIVSIALLSITTTSLFYSHYIIYSMHEFKMDIEIGDHLGFNVDTDALHFGLSMSPGKATRWLNISHQNKNPLQVDIQTAGYLGSWIYIEEPSFVLEPNVNKEVTVECHIPENIEYGHYNGTLKVIFKRII